jgi:prepilin-type N-terminal cleavage/methylation domain-containing protein
VFLALFVCGVARISGRVGKLSHHSRGRLAAAGFTLVELLTVVAILAVLASVVIGFAQGAQERARVARCRAELAHLAHGLEDFRRSFGDYPAASSADAPDVLYFALTGYPGRNGQSRPRPHVDVARLTVGQRAKASNAHSLVPDPAFVDPWGNRYLYQHQPGADYLLYSAGPDGLSSQPDAGGQFTGGRHVAPIDADNVFADESP